MLDKKKKGIREEVHTMDKRVSLFSKGRAGYVWAVDARNVVGEWMKVEGFRGKWSCDGNGRNGNAKFILLLATRRCFLSEIFRLMFWNPKRFLRISTTIAISIGLVLLSVGSSFMHYCLLNLYVSHPMCERYYIWWDESAQVHVAYETAKIIIFRVVRVTLASLLTVNMWGAEEGPSRLQGVNKLEKYSFRNVRGSR